MEEDSPSMKQMFTLIIEIETADDDPDGPWTAEDVVMAVRDGHYVGWEIVECSEDGR